MVVNGADGRAATVRIAAAQHGVIARRQAIAAGLSPDAIGRLVNAGALIRLHPSVYALWTPSAEEERWRQRLTAGALWLGNASAVSHRAAAIELGIDGTSAAPIEYSTTGWRRSPGAGIVVHRVRSLPADETVVRGSLRITSVARTIVDLAALMESTTLELALESAFRLGVTRDEIATVLERSGPARRGRSHLRVLLEEYAPVGTESALETIVWELVRDEGLPPPTPQHVIRDPDGTFVARADFAYPEARLAIEAESYKHHSNPRDWARDRRRENALISLGWIVYRVMWGDALRRRPLVARDLTRLREERTRLFRLVPEP